MKQFVNFITAVSAKFSESAALRIAAYFVIVLALLLMYLNSEASEVSFIYNEF